MQREGVKAVGEEEHETHCENTRLRVLRVAEEARLPTNTVRRILSASSRAARISSRSLCCGM
jgi:hypothetical protein